MVKGRILIRVDPKTIATYKRAVRLMHKLDEVPAPDWTWRHEIESQVAMAADNLAIWDREGRDE